jgi:hypothetical protein
MKGLTKIRAGHYVHGATGWHILRTDGWEGPRGGNWSGWEHAYIDRYDNIVVDDFTVRRTLRQAVRDLDRDPRPLPGDAVSR